MAGYTPDSLVTVRPFTHRRDGDTVVIGDIDRNVFLAIPAEGLDILDALSAGRTVGETVRLYEEKYDETPDIEDFIAALEDEGFIGAETPAPPSVEGQTGHWRWRMQWLSQRAAQRLVGWPAMIVYGLISVAGLTLAADDPGLIPKSGGALLFPIDFAPLTWATIAIALVGVAIHEVGHVVAARAAGVPAGVGLGNQLYVLVAQTDMTGIWLAPKRQRYVAFAIGAIIDAVTSSFLVAFLWCARHGVLSVPRWSVLLATSVLLTYIMRIAWQCYFFVRTDGYYIISTAFNCKNLMADTEDYLRNVTARLRRRPRRIDQSQIPAREMKVVRWYAVFWFLGRLISFVMFGLTVLPVLVGYLYQFFQLVSGGHTKYGSVDFATIAILSLALDGGGLLMWFRSLRRAARARRDRYARAERRATTGAESVIIPENVA
jgi:hypothetical protein